MPWRSMADVIAAETKEDTNMSKPKGITVGQGDCPYCGHKVAVRSQAKSGRLTYHCPRAVDGGCGHQHFARDDRNDELVAARVVKSWVKPEYRALYSGQAAAAEAAPADDDPTARELFGG